MAKRGAQGTKRGRPGAEEAVDEAIEQARSKRTEPPPERLDYAVWLLCVERKRYGLAVKDLADRYGISERQAQTDIARAREVIAEEEKEERPARKDILRAYLWNAIKLAEDAGDFRAVGAFTGQLAKLDGLNSPAQVEATVTHGGVMVVGERMQTAEDWLAAVNSKNEG